MGENFGLLSTMLLLTELEEVFVLTFKAYGPNAVRSMCLECQNKYFPYGPKSRLVRALLYAYTNKIVYDESLLSWSMFIVLVRCPVHKPVRTDYLLSVRLCTDYLSTNQIKYILSVFQSVYNNIIFLTVNNF